MDIEYTSCVINVFNGLSYDTALRTYDVAGRYVFNTHVEELTEMIKFLKSHDDEKKDNINNSTNLKLLCDIIYEVGYINTTLNFECCSDFGNNCCDTSTGSNKNNQHYYFVKKEFSGIVIDTIIHMLTFGSQVICSDFAVKALISNWDNEKFNAKCPFKFVDTQSGSICVRYGIKPCKECIFPQLSSLGSMAISDVGDFENTEIPISSICMNAMNNTIVYALKEIIDERIDVKVYSVAIGNSYWDDSLEESENINEVGVNLPRLKRTNATLKFNQTNVENIKKNIKKEIIIPFKTDEHFVKAYGTINIRGTPVHSIVTFKHFSGSMIISSLHLTNLIKVNTCIENVINQAINTLGRTRSEQIEKEIKNISLDKPELLRSVTSGFVSEITASSTHVRHKVLKTI